MTMIFSQYIKYHVINEKKYAKINGILRVLTQSPSTINNYFLFLYIKRQVRERHEQRAKNNIQYRLQCFSTDKPKLYEKLFSGTIILRIVVNKISFFRSLLVF